jgi:hypothetical protein
LSSISHRSYKPIIFQTVNLTPEILQTLKKDGLAKIHLHIDSVQEREGWTGSSESGLNTLRQHYAEMIHKTGKIQCGFHVTVYRSNLPDIPKVLAWGLKNLDKVQHISFIAYRTIPVDENLAFFAGGKQITADQLPNRPDDSREIDITTEEMIDVLKRNSFHIRAPISTGLPTMDQISS